MDPGGSYEYRVLWTPDRVKKQKHWNDGLLVFNASTHRYSLYDDDKRRVSSVLAPLDQAESLCVGQTREVSRYIVNLEEFIGVRPSVSSESTRASSIPAKRPASAISNASGNTEAVPLAALLGTRGSASLSRPVPRKARIGGMLMPPALRRPATVSNVVCGTAGATHASEDDGRHDKSGASHEAGQDYRQCDKSHLPQGTEKGRMRIPARERQSGTDADQEVEGRKVEEGSAMEQRENDSIARDSNVPTKVATVLAEPAPPSDAIRTSRHGICVEQACHDEAHRTLDKEGSRESSYEGHLEGPSRQNTNQFGGNQAPPQPGSESPTTQDIAVKLEPSHESSVRTDGTLLDTQARISCFANAFTMPLVPGASQSSQATVDSPTRAPKAAVAAARPIGRSLLSPIPQVQCPLEEDATNTFVDASCNPLSCDTNAPTDSTSHIADPATHEGTGSSWLNRDSSKLRSRVLLASLPSRRVLADKNEKDETSSRYAALAEPSIRSGDTSVAAERITRASPLAPVKREPTSPRKIDTSRLGFQFVSDIYMNIDK